MLVYEAVGKVMRQLGVDTVFGLLGNGNFRMVQHMTENHNVSYYGARHETSAVSMADGYARATGRLGVCTVTQGPGLTNTLTALTEAVKGRTPLLLLAGDTPSNSLFYNQSIDQEAVVSPLGVGVQPLRGPNKAVEDVMRAARRAQTERRPVLVSLPLDVQGEECVVEEGYRFADVEYAASRPSAEAVSEVIELIESARHPVVLAGRGAALGGAKQQLEALADRIGALVATSAVAKGLFAGNPFDVGISGGFSSPLAVRLMSQADLILSFGASLNVWTTGYGKLFPSARIVQCDVDPTAIGTMEPVTLGLVGDAGETASALLDELLLRDAKLEGYRNDVVAREIREFRWEDEIEDESTEDTLDPQTLVIELNKMLPKERAVATDTGHFVGFPAMHLSVPDPSGFIFAQAFASVGLGMGTGLGAAIARPDRPTVIAIGDGGLLMTLGELATAVEYDLPILVLVFNDAAYGSEIHHFGSLGLPTDLARLDEKDFASIASAMNARGLTVRKLSDLEGLRSWLDAPEGPMVLDCKINPSVRARWHAERAASAYESVDEG